MVSMFINYKKMFIPISGIIYCKLKRYLESIKYNNPRWGILEILKLLKVTKSVLTFTTLLSLAHAAVACHIMSYASHSRFSLPLSLQRAVYGWHNKKIKHGEVCLLCVMNWWCKMYESDMWEDFCNAERQICASR